MNINIDPLPFPPKVDIKYLVDELEFSDKSRGPNSFLIYRKLFNEHLRRLNYRFTMTQVSKIAAFYWKGEKRIVKKAYRKLALDIENGLSRRRQRNPTLLFTIFTPSDRDLILQQSGYPSNIPTNSRPNLDNINDSSNPRNPRLNPRLNPDLTLVPETPDNFDNSESDHTSSPNDNDHISPPSNVLDSMFEQYLDHSSNVQIFF